jgi:hypothetical protein
VRAIDRDWPISRTREGSVLELTTTLKLRIVMKPLRERYAETVCAPQDVAEFRYRGTPINILRTVQFRGSSAREDDVACVLKNELMLLVI